MHPHTISNTLTQSRTHEELAQARILKKAQNCKRKEKDIMTTMYDKKLSKGLLINGLMKVMDLRHLFPLVKIITFHLR